MAWDLGSGEQGSKSVVNEGMTKEATVKISCQIRMKGD